ncbi:chloramphenicol efflux pump [Planotetraspora silvatica]|uniref:Chloramphenicol efflux pump n=1 Tax=Planotetraspora silvatica TaxID=234614 RepID=A0A8J3UH79_9ACTN|nr:MFS transporter [Planotetraspora silvatica]GII45248.1 chloramphenicol efflux pump [Planotetraspora silvatica]
MASDRAPTTGTRATWALVALGMATFIYITVELLPIGLLTVMAADLHRTPSEMGLIVTGYATVVVLASVPLARLALRVPRRTLLAVTLGVLTIGSLLTAAAPSYPVLLTARLLTALTQALFWSVVATTAIGLFPPKEQGRVVARLAIGNSIAPVFGVPAGTWLGQQAGWRVSFVVMAVLALVTCVALIALLPAVSAAGVEPTRGSAPDARRYALLLTATVIGVTGFLTAYTYITPYLEEVSGFAPQALGSLLLASGVAGVVGTIAVGAHLDRRPRAALIVPLVVITGALLGLYALGTAQAPAIVALCLTGLSFSALATAIQNRTLQVAPGSTDIASAGTSSAFNVGIAAGSLLGGVLIDGLGTRSVALTGALLTSVALAALLSERWLARPAKPADAEAAVAC